MPVPVVLLCGAEPTAMASTMVGMLFDLPDAVAVHHDIDVERQVLTRTVSDVSGVVERHEIGLVHACVACAVREDIVPTLARLARSGRWDTVLARLPVGAEPTQVCRVLSWDSRLSPALRVSAVVTALSAADPVADLLDDDLLADRGLHTAHDDRRGVGEVLAAMLEYADAVSFDGTPSPVARGLVAALARPGVPLSEGTSGLPGADLRGTLHQHERTERWTSPTRTEALPHLTADGVWRLDLQSLQPFHPQRLLDSIGLLGGGRHRSRGCFWLPTRPERATAWSGSGGQLSIGDHAAWGRRMPFTRIVVTGVGATAPDLHGPFESLLVDGLPRDDRAAAGWQWAEDGFEPWLGPIRDAA